MKECCLTGSPTHGEAPEYNTLDASLWFFQAIYQYYQYTADKTFVKSMLPVLKGIIDRHYNGTRYNIKVDPTDELLSGGEDGVQLTWMDAKVGDFVITPRRGKPVEVNSLWYNALRIMETLLDEVGKRIESEGYRIKADMVLESFNMQFWNEKQNALYDFIDGGYKNDDIRPNQIFALSLPFPLLSGMRAKKVFDLIAQQLLTPRGLRTLSPGHKDYRPTYGGDVWMRDGAYHQGTVWSYLIGPFIDAAFYVCGKEYKEEATRYIDAFFQHLQEAGVGTVSEIFDAAPPHVPRGCISQAWGVGEVVRVAIKYGLVPGTTKPEEPEPLN